MPLADIKISKAKPQNKPYKLFDGGGLFLLVNPGGSKLWRLKYRFLGKERLYSMGAYPTVTLAQARQERGEIKGLLAKGIEPTQHRRMTLYQKKEAGGHTFEAMARRWVELKKIVPTHRKTSLRRLEKHIFPKIGFRPIGEIETYELSQCLEKVEKLGIGETAHRVKQLIQQTFRYAVRRGVIKHNPAGDLRDLLAAPERSNFASIPPAELPDLLKAMEDYQGDALTKAALRLMALTFVRTGELIAAKWEEIDWAREEWCIPAERMKMRRPHLVPLSRQALEAFKKLQKLTGKHPYVFYSAANDKKYLSNGAILSALKRMGYTGRMTGHGFRSLASTILNEQRIHHPDIIEKQLAHADRNEVRAAYNRADYLLERKKMMQDWANYLDITLCKADAKPVFFNKNIKAY